MPSVAVHTDVFEQLTRSVALANGMPTARQAYVPQPVVDRSGGPAPRLYRGNRPGFRPSLPARDRRGADPAARRRRFERAFVRANHAATPRAGQRGQPPRAVPGEPVDRPSAGRPADRGAGRGDAARHEPPAGRDRRHAPADRLSGILGIHRREGRGQRRDGRRAAGIPAGHPRARRDRADRALVEHQLVRRRFRGQRADPQGNRHERRDRRDGTLQSRQRDDRAGLQPGFDQPAGRLGAGRHLHGLGRQLVQLFRDLRRGRGAQPLADPSMSRGGSPRKRARRASSSAPGTPTPATARARPGRRISGAPSPAASTISRRSS